MVEVDRVQGGQSSQGKVEEQQKKEEEVSACAWGNITSYNGGVGRRYGQSNGQQQQQQKQQQQQQKCAVSSTKRPTMRSLGSYLVGKTMGEGTFGKVKYGVHSLTGEKVRDLALERKRYTPMQPSSSLTTIPLAR